MNLKLHMRGRRKYELYDIYNTAIDYFKCYMLSVCTDGPLTFCIMKYLFMLRRFTISHQVSPPVSTELCSSTEQSFVANDIVLEI